MPDACGELISVDEIGDVIGMPVRAVEWSDITLPPDSSPADELPGEMAREAARTASERLDCMWWPTESGGWRLPVHVLRLDSATEAALFDALADSTEYSRADIGGYPVFERSYENEVGGLSLSYAFVDGLWIATTTPTLPQPLAEIMTIIIGRVTAA